MPKSRMHILSCDVGAIIAEDVKNYQGVILVAKDTVLNQYIINRLVDFGISHVWIYTSDDFAVEEKTSTENNSNHRSKLIKSSHVEAVQVVKQVLRELSAGGKLNYPKISRLSKLVYGNINNSAEIITYLNQIKSKDEYTYNHCVNVAFYAMLIAKWLKLAEEEIDQVIQAGLLHDIGKVLIPDEVLNKPGKLSAEEFDIIKSHALLGYHSLNLFPEISQAIKDAVLLHHERSDGSGYPYGLQDHEIPLIAKIIAIADVYDAMTQDRIYKKGVNPFAAFEMFLSIGMGIFDVQILNVFLKNISLNFTGLNVILENGESGEIVYVPPYEITKPVVLKGTTFIDITQLRLKELTIAKV